MIEIVPVKTRLQEMTFVRFANKMYEDCPYYTPCLEFDDINTFRHRKNPALDHSEFVRFLAYKDGRVVGRICGIINHLANKKWNVKKCRFGWFDFEDDFEISERLLNAVADWGRSKGMELLNGPVGFTDFDHEGLLLEGYDYYAPMASLYNFPYYVKHYERLGFTKEADWIEMQYTTPTEVPERFRKVAEMLTERLGVRVDKVRSVKELKQKYGMTYFDVLDSAYQKLYNFQPLTERQKHYYTNMYFPLLNFDFVTIIVNRQNEIVGVGLGMPDISKELKETNGKVLPFGWIKLLKAFRRKKFDVLDLLLIAVREDYQNTGINALFFNDMIPYFIKYGVKYAESTSVLETNFKMLSQFNKHFEYKQHKRRRAYIRNI